MRKQDIRYNNIAIRTLYDIPKHEQNGIKEFYLTLLKIIEEDGN